jgi:NAD(P)-dependent dehydrogenase (short-subunit alcohol dehydrogenase family)
MTVDLDRKNFTAADQARFARVSGDYNPLHLDPIVARRTQLGAPIVHGIHAVLWALDALFRDQAISAHKLQVNFLEPIYVGETAIARITRRSETEARLNIEVGGAVVTAITLSFGDAGKRASAPIGNSIRAIPWPRLPVELDLEAMSAQAGAVALGDPQEDLTSTFPALSREISARRVGAMIALSPLVGMISPGLHSILKSFSLEFVEDDNGETLRYSTLDVNKRFRLVRMAVSGPGVTGECLAYARVPPIAQAAMKDIAALVPKGAYAGARVLIIGGSRGLGEVAAKACAAGGADVLITYAIGRGDAERIVEEISADGGHCRALAFDIRGDIGVQLASLSFAPSHVYYFAACPSISRHNSLLNENLLQEFLRFYAEGFFRLCSALLNAAQGRDLRIFYPSALAVAQPLRGSTEFAMAKAAGEVLCRNMDQYLPGAQVLCRRLPRVLTDQSATVSPAEARSALEVVLPIVHEMQTGSGASVQVQGRGSASAA